MNSWNIPRRRTDDQLRERINLGMQCPECYGVRTALLPHDPHTPYVFQCAECGNQWQRQ